MFKKATFVILFLGITLVLYVLLAPPRWWLNMVKEVDLQNPAQTGEKLVQEYQCRQCHKIGRVGALKAPNLDETTLINQPDLLNLWLLDPPAVKPNTAMPNFYLSDSEIIAIMAYLTSLQHEATP